MTYLFGVLIFGCGAFVGLIVGLFGASRRDGPATWTEPMEWESYGGEK